MLSPTRQVYREDIRHIERAIGEAEAKARREASKNPQGYVWLSFDKLRRLKDNKVDVRKIGSGLNANVFSVCPKGRKVLYKNCMVVKPICTKPSACVDEANNLSQKGNYLKDVSYEEANVTKRLGELKNRNIVKAYHVTGDEASNSAVLYMEALAPWKSGPTIGNLIQAAKNSRRLSRAQWASIIFQAMFAIAKIQKRFKGFRHNDLHGGNLMLTQWGAESPTYKVGSQCFGFPRSFPRGVVIDFGWSTQTKRDGELGIKHRWDEITKDFGKHLRETRYIDRGGSMKSKILETLRWRSPRTNG